MAKEIIDFLTEYFNNTKTQIFYTRNTAGDDMQTIYNKNNVIIDYCPYWEYIEIFGLEKDNYNEVVKAVGDLLSAFRY